MVKGLRDSGPIDFAVTGAQPRLGDGHVVPVGDEGSRTLVFAVPDGRAKVTAVPITADGKRHAAVTLDIAGGTTATLAVPDQVDGAKPVAYSISASGGAVYGGLILEGAEGNGLSTPAILPAAGGRQSVAVTLGY
jgi:hypothetical protein